ncbi:hypothetical protein [Bradyrhizobium elkanii]
MVPSIEPSSALSAPPLTESSLEPIANEAISVDVAVAVVLMVKLLAPVR